MQIVHKLALAVVPALLIAGCSRGAKPASEVQAASAKKPEAPLVTVANAEARKLEKSILVTGSLVADESVTISPEVQGRVSAIRADFGQHVAKGAVVAELDRTEYALQVERVKASLNQALSRLGLKPGETAPPTSTPAMRQSQAQLEDARFKFESASKLVKTGDISQERFNEIEKSYRARQAAFDAVSDEMRTLWGSVETLRA